MLTIQYYQNVWTGDLDAVNGAFKVTTENFFKNIDDLNLDSYGLCQWCETGYS